MTLASTHGSKQSLSSTISFYCHNYSLLKTKIAINTFHKTRYPHIFEKAILLLDFLQLISQIILINPAQYEDVTFSERPLTKGMVYCSQIINPSQLLSYENSDILTAVCLLIVLCFSILRAMLFLAVVYISSRGLNNNSWLIDLWKLIFTLQRPILCYFITSFWVRAMIAAQDSTFTMLGMSDLGLMVLSCFMFGFEYIFTALIETQFCYILPSKSFLACKNYKVQATTLVQKIVIQIFQLGMINPDTIGNRWILSTITLIFSFVRNFQHYATLPLYKLEALSFQSTILGIGISLHLSYFFQTFMKAVSYGGTDISYLLILWVVLLPACVLISQRLFKEKIEALFLSKTRGLPEVLLHKVIATIELKKKEKVPGIQTEKYTWNYLVSVAQKMRLKKTFNIDVEFTEDISESINQVEHANRIYTYYLEKLLEKFPQNKVIKLYLAYFYAKKTKLYAKATKVISEIGQSAWSTIGLNASLLVYDIQKSIIKGHYSDNSQLDLSRYIESQTVVEQLKFKIIEQLDLKIKVIRNIIGEKADLGEVSECALLFDKHKSEIEKRISLLYNMIPDYYMEPLLICADYYLVMDYSLEQYLRYEKLYYHKLSKYEKPLKEGNLVEENMYETDNVFIILSGQKIDNGRILYCSKSIEDVCGGDHATYVNSHVSRLFTPALQNFYTEFFRQALETGDGILNTRVRGYLNHKEGHAVEVEFCVKVHPFITENLYLNLMLRPVPLTSEYLLVKENGDIEGASKDISEVLGINWTFQTSSPLVNVKALSDELALMNEAYNNANKKDQPDSVTLFGKKVSTMVLEDINNSPTLKSLSYFNIQRVKTVDYDLDLAEGKKIQLRSLRRKLSYSSNPDGKFYHCKISGAVYGTVFLKRIALDMTRGADDHSRDHQLSFVDSSARKRNSSAKLKNKKFSLEVFEVSDVVGDEKQGGWIDFLSFRSGIDAPDSPTGIGHRNRADESHTNLLSPSRKSTKRLLVSTERTKSLKYDHSLAALPDAELEVNVEKKMIQSPAKLLKKKKTGPVSGSQSLASPQKRRTYKSFKAAVTTKFYPRSFKMLCLGFYTVIILTFFVQIGLRIITDSAISDLVTKKNMLNDSQSRMFNLIRIQSLARTSLEYIVLRLTPTELGSATATAASPLGDVARLMVPLIAANQDISSNLGYLSNSMRDELAMTDIRLYGSCDEGVTSTYQNFTIYQATDILISAGKTSTLISNVYSTQGQNSVTFMTWNMMNDILLKNAKITSELTKSVADQKDYLQNLLVYSLVIILIFLIATGAVLTFNIWYQYSIDKRHILELLRLNHVALKNVLQSSENFKKSLNEEEEWNELQQLDILEDPFKSAYVKTSGNERKKRHEQSIDYIKLRVKYWVYFMKLIVNIAILVGVAIWNNVSIHNDVSNIYALQGQLQFANTASRTLAIAYSGPNEWFYSMDTMLIEGEVPSVKMVSIAQEMKDVQNQAAGVFMGDYESYDPTIKKILFDEGCFIITVTSDLNNCKKIAAQGRPTNFLSVLADFDALLTQRIALYKASDGSYNALKTIFVNTFSAIIPDFRSTAAQIQLIGGIVNTNLGVAIDKSEKNRNILLIVSSLCLFGVGLTVWYQIMSQLRNMNNNFKKVLQIFPPNLVLSNFILKTFLTKTSRTFAAYMEV